MTSTAASGQMVVVADTALRKRLVVTGLLAAAVVAAAVAGAVAALLAVSSLTSAPVMFLAAGIVVLGLLDAAGAWWVAARRAAPGHRRRAGWTMFTTSAALVLGAFAVSLAPPAVEAPPAPTVPGAHLLDLSTGSRVAVVTVPALLPAAPRAPIVVLHGGPGIPDLAANTAATAPLAAMGSDVHLYAQLGTSTSTRLADPRGYGRDRDVADLEALRVVLGLDRMTLLGHSYGATVAAAYTAAHPEHVERLVLTSPAALDPADTSATRATTGLSAGRTLDLYRQVLAPRDLLGYLLLQTNPAAAHAFFGDREADARNDAVLTLAEPTLVCHGPPAGLPPVTGSGFYAMQYPQSATAPAPRDIRPALTGMPVPTLIVKGGCDYLSWRSAIDYRRRLPRSQLLYLPDAGHNVAQDQPTAFLEAVTAFLLHRPVPGDLVTDDAVPQGYLGPP